MSQASELAARRSLKRGSEPDQELPSPDEYTVFSVSRGDRLHDIAKQACQEVGGDVSRFSVRSTREYVGAVAAQVLGGPAQRVTTPNGEQPTVDLQAVPATLSGAERVAGGTVSMPTYRINPSAPVTQAIYIGVVEVADERVPDALACRANCRRNQINRLPQSVRRLLDRLLSSLTQTGTVERKMAITQP